MIDANSATTENVLPGDRINNQKPDWLRNE